MKREQNQGRGKSSDDGSQDSRGIQGRVQAVPPGEPVHNAFVFSKLIVLLFHGTPALYHTKKVCNCFAPEQFLS